MMMEQQDEAAEQEQLDLERRLKAPLDPASVRKRKGPRTQKNPNGLLDYLSGGDVKLALFRACGPLGWSSQILDGPTLMLGPLEESREEASARPGGEARTIKGWSATATAKVRVLVGPPSAPFAYHDDVGKCSTEWQRTAAEAVELVMSGAVTDALKRAAAPFGPTLGLALLQDEEDREDLELVERKAPARRKGHLPAKVADTLAPPPEAPVPSHGEQLAEIAHEAGLDLDPLPAELATAIRKSADPIERPVVRELHAWLVARVGEQAARAVWQSVGIENKPGVKIQRKHVVGLVEHVRHVPAKAAQ